MRVMRPPIKAAASFALLSASCVAAQNISDSLPVVDLGYELYRAAEFNQTGGYYNFSNIRYAAPPLGDLRFRAPVPPAINRSVINDGMDGRICPQGSPAWQAIASKFLLQYLATGTVPNITTTSSSNSSVIPARDPRENEDCLFLDVIVPEKVFEGAGQGYGAPVLVWIYGGGYTGGSKGDSGDPIGLVSRSITNYSDGVIYVSMNYRLGAFGWLSGPSLQENGTANAGLYDQRMALEWVQENIHLFGGDKNRVTVFGESAGGGSIMHQITAYGGLVPSPFQQAIPQSPGWVSNQSPYYQEQTFQAFLDVANASCLAEARNLPSDVLIAANAIQVANSSYGQFTYGPTVDGNFVPQDPKALLDRGQFDKSVKIMVGHNADEGLVFVPPLHTNSDFTSYIQSSFSNAKPAVIDYIVNTLYPPVFDGSLGYKDNVGRAALSVSEYSFTCNAYALDRAYNNKTYAYLFAVSPAIHGQDVAYTYYNPGAPSAGGSLTSLLPTNQTVAFALQDYITSFAAKGRPDSMVDGLPLFEMYGDNATVVDLTSSSISDTMDPAANARCRWWQLGLYY